MFWMEIPKEKIRLDGSLIKLKFILEGQLAFMETRTCTVK